MTNDKMSQTDVAKFFRVHPRKASRWEADGCVFNPFVPIEICKWIRLNRQRIDKELKKRIVEIEKEHAIETSGGNIKPPSNEKERKTLEDFRDYYIEQLNIATAANLADEIKHWSDLLLKTEKCLREAQAHERKLGLEQGETIKREEVERIMKAILFAGNACIKNQIKQMAQGLSMKTPQEIYAILPAAILGGKIFEGLSAVSKSDSEVEIPQWMIDCLVEDGGNYIRNIEDSHEVRNERS